jgi:hypothetical protein
MVIRLRLVSRTLFVPESPSVSSIPPSHMSVHDRAYAEPRHLHSIGQFYDPVSWIPGVFPGEGAADLYDASYGLKPAYYAVRDTIKAAAANAKFKGKKI